MAIMAVDSLWNAVLRCSLFGDDRDNLLCRWNLLQASWGHGKAYYAAGQPAVALTSWTPMCRFKAIGYSAIPHLTGKDVDDYLTCTIRNRSDLVEKSRAQIAADFHAALGNRPNISVAVEDVQDCSKDGQNPITQVSVYVTEKTSQGVSKSVAAADVHGFFSSVSGSAAFQGLQRKHNIEAVGPRPQFLKEQVKAYQEQPPDGLDTRLWKQAHLDNPDAAMLLPVPLIGFRALQSRIRQQEKQTKSFQGRLEEVATDISQLQKQQQDNTAKLRDIKRKQLELSHRVLGVILKQETTRKLGFTIQLEEERLRMQLEALEAQISAPTQFKGRLNELLSQVRLQSQLSSTGGAERSVDAMMMQDVKSLLNHQHQGLQVMVSTMKKDIATLEYLKKNYDSGAAKV